MAYMLDSVPAAAAELLHRWSEAPEEAWSTLPGLVHSLPPIETRRLLLGVRRTPWRPSGQARAEFEWLVATAERADDRGPGPGMFSGPATTLQAPVSVGPLAVDPTGNWVAACAWMLMRIWLLPDGKALPSIRHPRGGIDSMLAAPDGRFLITRCSPKFYVWKMPEGVLVSRFSVPHAWEYTMSPDGCLLAIALPGRCSRQGLEQARRRWTWPGHVQLRRLPDGELIREFDLPEQLWGVALAFNRDGTYLTAACRRKRWRVFRWALTGGEPDLRHLPADGEDWPRPWSWPYAGAYDPDRERWALAPDATMFANLRGMSDNPRGGDVLQEVSDDQRDGDVLRVWDLATGGVVGVPAAPESATGVEFTADGACMVFRDHAGLHLVEPRPGGWRGVLSESEVREPLASSFSGEWLAESSKFGTIHLWGSRLSGVVRRAFDGAAIREVVSDGRTGSTTARERAWLEFLEALLDVPPLDAPALSRDTDEPSGLAPCLGERDQFRTKDSS